MDFDSGNLNGSNKTQTVERELEFDSLESDSEQDDTDDQETIPIDTQIAELRKAMQGAIELFEDQVAKGNEKFAERFMASNQMNRALVDESKHRRNMPTMYLQ
ncbi:hypothetical protein H634G_09362 [Metarhizium anisopliae BRIP 53293]|uniref:Uncharacterized protein n=1 Tax=Metarhizium anisopliae BRIP 53293 TaxID=1291518 RepID=A0A0D9NN24_METAN|nr:hypothetical protein H634G_09362 [Metarhizium anisopliae BRIP 53293]KJK91759.1 hypothetical protein H633G_04375 [Metarhizium anisopliae BRIP 53284]